MVGFAWQAPFVSFRTPPISVSATLSETLQLPVSRGKHRDQAQRRALPSGLLWAAYIDGA